MEPYLHSGRLGRMSLIAVLVAAPLVVLLGAVYSYLIVWLPIAGYITFLITCGFGYACGAVAAIAGKAGHCRSPRAMRVAGLLLGALALYSAWIFFLRALLGRDADAGAGLGVLDLVTHPRACWMIVRAINEHGWYSVKTMTPSGAFLTVLWLIEAVVVVGLTTLGAPTAVTDELYCEGCGRWCRTTATTWRQLSAAQATLDRGAFDHAALLALPEVARPRSPRLKIDRLACAACGVTGGLRFSRSVDTTNGKGQVKTKEHVLHPLRLVDATAVPGASTDRVSSVAS